MTTHRRFAGGGAAAIAVCALLTAGCGDSPDQSDPAGGAVASATTPASITPSGSPGVSPTPDGTTGGSSAAPSPAGTDIADTAATVPMSTELKTGNENDTRTTFTGLRAASHDGYDRVVLDFDGATPGYRVEYWTDGDTPGTLHLRAIFQRVENTQATSLGSGLPVVTQVQQDPPFEGAMVVSIAVHSTTQLPFGVGLLDGRVYIDVAHPAS